jgi:hypothetical protein
MSDFSSKVTFAALALACTEIAFCEVSDGGAL